MANGHKTGIDSSEWLIGLLENTFQQKVAKCSVTALGEGTGFLSNVSKISIDWKTGNDDSKSGHTELPRSVVLKMPLTTKPVLPTPASAIQLGEPQQSESLNMSEHLSRAHQVECSVYDFFEQTEAHKAFPIPKMYSCQSSGEPLFILASDLSGIGKTPSIADGVTLEQCRSMLRVLARVQVHCLVNWEQWSQLTTKLKAVQDESFTQKLGLMAKKTSAALCQAFPQEMVLSEADIQSLMDPSGYYKYLKGEEGRRVMVHGDAWLNNFLVQCNSFGELADTVTALIDWQMVHEGCWSRDLCFLMVSSLNSGLRKAHELQLLQEFYESFKASLKEECARKNLCFDAILAPFTFDHLLRSYKSGLKHCAIQFMLQSSFWCLNPETVAKYGKGRVADVIQRYITILQEEMLVLIKRGVELYIC